MNPFAVAADLIVFVHLLYIGFTAGGAVFILTGAVLHWQWIRNRIFRFVHLGAVLAVALESLAGIWCPLTVFEWQLRHRAEQAVESDIPFVGRMIRKLVFVELPSWGYTVLYIGFGLLVTAGFFLVPPRRKESKS